MRVGIIGLNHFSSSLFLREKIAKICQTHFQPNAQKLNSPYILLSTCNRTELYFSSPHLTETHSEILQIFRSSLRDHFEHALYSYFGGDCFLHLARVISGMDSLIFGETEIQRQVKCAYEIYRKETALTSSLHYLFQKGLKIGKEMRTSFLPAGERLSQTFFSLMSGRELRTMRFLFIGNSAINRGLMTYFDKKGCTDLTLCTRTKVENRHFNVRGWDVLDEWTNYDAIISGTFHKEYVLKNRIDLNRLNRLVFLFDLGMPRNIDPNLGLHQNIQLYHIDELCRIANQATKTKTKDVKLCETRIEQAVKRQIELFQKKQQSRWRYAALCDDCSCVLAH